ncbi:16S rRNA (uracil(1498)-N(3))-methyltransferase [Robiginitalea sp. M366]|uniref:16S rRNA (uracil(1498)-N(3))-methyltransferase n=1 Tax=Robiginitalea aestuariiviva TaxID=3036903 RepID=UPI00240D2949|nr:16S rRNA (uracil(1498)-N(3))-methyltransferase [Robiginitalea aestuariiviva]MDG1572694.1 16S rRNA (uracil(1498)-N(3))-methyltransferase [Robiginitalea aestuariiviva]
MNYFYHPTLDGSVTQFAFNPEESRHIVKVLRKREGDVMHITNGKGDIFRAEILEANPKRCMGRIRDARRVHPKRFHLHMVVAPTKKTDRFEWFLEKATEIGVNEITPLICAHSERRALSMDRLQRVVQEAMKQSLRAYLPQLNPSQSFADFLKQPQPTLKFIAHCQEDEKVELKRRLAADQDVVVLIGPEGDFSPEEIQQAEDAGFLPVSLGESRLRTETAALVACTVVNLINHG